MPIAVILRPVTSGTRATFRMLVLNGQEACGSATTRAEDSSEAVRQAVERTSGGVSVIGLAYLDREMGLLVGLVPDILLHAPWLGRLGPACK